MAAEQAIRPDSSGSDDYSFSNPRLVNFRVRLFSVTVRTTCSGAPEGISATISRVTSTFDPTDPAKCATASSAILPASRQFLLGQGVQSHDIVWEVTFHLASVRRFDLRCVRHWLPAGWSPILRSPSAYRCLWPSQLSLPSAVWRRSPAAPIRKRSECQYQQLPASV
jgi:hypothetical protein